MTQPPISETQLHLIAKDACETTLKSTYAHAQTPEWNTTIINKILTSLISTASTSTSAAAADARPAEKPQYKYAVNSTIIQHLDVARAGDERQEVSPPGTPEGGGGEGVGVKGEGVEPGRGRRGMHSATGAYWNEETDGMWSFKWEGGEGRGMDVVVSVIWVAVG